MAWTDKYVTADAAGGGDGSSGSPWTLAEAIAGITAGDRVNMKAGTYANTTTNRAFATAGATNTPIWWRGYKTTIGDLDAAPTANRTAATDMPLLTFTSGQFQATAAHQWFSSMAVSASALNGPVVSATGGTLRFHRVRATNTTANSASEAFSVATNHYVDATECWFGATATAARVAITNARQGYIHGCVFEGGLIGLYQNVAVGEISNCVFDSNGSDAIYIGAPAWAGVINQCTIYNPTGHGINFTATALTGWSRVIGTLFHTIQQAGKSALYYGNATPTNLVFRANNAFYNCTTPETGFGDTTDFDRVTETSDPLDNAAADDFDLTTNALSKSASFPGLYEGVAYKSYADIGALQRAEPAGGGGGARIIGG